MGVRSAVNSFCGLADETTWGTPVAVASGKYNRFVTESIIADSDITDGSKAKGRAIITGRRQVRKRSAGDIVLDNRYEGQELWYRQFFGSGQAAPSLIDTSAYTHVFRPKTTRYAGASLELHLDVDKYIIPGVKLDKWGLKIDEGIPQSTFGVNGKPPTGPTSPASSPTFLEDASGSLDINDVESSPAVGFTCQIGPASTFSSPVTIDGLVNASIDAAWPLTGPRSYRGNPAAAEPIITGPLSVQGSISREYLGSEIVAYWLTGAAVYIRFKFTGQVAGATSALYMFQVDIPEARIQKALPSVNDGPLTEDIPFVADASIGTDLIVVTLLNKRGPTY